jgi:hypothetical protein
VALTDLKIKKAKAKEKSYKLYDSLGLFVLVRPNGSKLWRQKYQLNGKESTIAHGSYPAVSLRDARQKRDEIRDQLAATLLHKSADGRGFPLPGQTHPTASVTGIPSAVKPFSTATRIWNSAT